MRERHLRLTCPAVRARVTVATTATVAALVMVTAMAVGAMASGRADAAGAVTSGSGAATATETAVRLDAPTARAVASEAPVVPTATPLEPIVNTSNCRRDLGTPAMTVSIPQISMSCPVHAGGQSTLDAGAATLLDQAAMSSVLAHEPGAAGTLWIGGHRSSHGGAFAAVPGLADGAVVVISDGATTATYQIVGRVYVTVENGQVKGANGVASGAATADAILRADRGAGRAPRLVLQTCDGEDHRWMIYADLIGVTND